MRHILVGGLILLSTAALATLGSAKPSTHYSTSAFSPRDDLGDRPLSLEPLAASRAGRCTLSFGYTDGEGFAIEGDIWNFDHGGADPFEGWTSFDLTAQSRTYWRHIAADIWVDGDVGNGNVATGNLVPVPILSGTGSAWIGAFQNEADQFCWSGGLGYGDQWCEELLGPVLDYDGSSSISIDYEHFVDLEEGFDGYSLRVRTLPSGTETELAFFDDRIGLAADHPVSPPDGEDFGASFDSFGGDTQFRLVFKMTSDGAWSDQDAEYPTEYGPLAIDNVALGNTGPAGDVDVVYDFESGLGGWSPVTCPGLGSFAGIAPVTAYTIEDPCSCQLDGNVLEHHDENGEHPYGQNTIAESNPVDVENDVADVCGSVGSLEIFADWSQYSIQPRANGVFYRPGWNYYPFICPTTGETGWSGPIGQRTYFSTGDDAVCFLSRNIATDNGIPSDVEQIRFNYEINASCDAFSIPPEECTETTNFTPLIDNIRIRFVLVPNAPPLSYDPGDRYQDGFNQSLLLDPNEPGNANTVRSFCGGSSPIILGDSLHVIGPVPSEGFEYDARLWFRVAYRGPGSNTAGYDAWRARVQQDGGLDDVDGVTDIEAGEFATAKMDSSQIGVNPSSSKFHSYFIEEDARHDHGASENSDENEIIADGVLLPGTKIEYFVTGNYLTSPNEFSFLPDTTGGFFSEFEILPRWRDDNGTLKFPCVLYVDAFNSGAETFIEAALDAVGIDNDRYDYNDASS